jgi:enamine deaminase RidA (YjgF/YER057c/UK114 family)
MSSEWKWPIAHAHNLAASAGRLTFVGGAGDFDAAGLIRRPGDLEAQLAGTLENLASALAIEGCDLADVVRLKGFYKSDGSLNEWELLAALAHALAHDPLPAITLHPVPLQPFPGQALQLQAIALRGWRSDPNRRVVTGEVPAHHRHRFGRHRPTLGLRAGEFIAVPARTAVDDEGQALAAGDGVAQTRIVMGRLEETLRELGASTRISGRSRSANQARLQPSFRVTHYGPPVP